MPDSAGIAVDKVPDAISEPKGEHLLLSRNAEKVKAFANVLGETKRVIVHI